MDHKKYASSIKEEEGISIMDMAIESCKFVDVNVRSGTVYYYSLRQSLADAIPWEDISKC